MLRDTTFFNHKTLVGENNKNIHSFSFSFSFLCDQISSTDSLATHINFKSERSNQTSYGKTELFRQQNTLPIIADANGGQDK